MRVEAASGATSIVADGGDIGSALGVALDDHPHIVTVTDSGKLIHVVPVSGAHHMLLNNDWFWRDVAAMPDNTFAAVNLPSATPCGMFRMPAR